MPAGRIAYLNARLLDPATGLDETGALLVEDGKIADFGAHLFKGGAPSVRQVVDCEGLCLAPGLVDMRVQLREPGQEHLEDINSAGDAALAGGVTQLACLPNTEPAIDDVPVVEFIARRAREAKKVKINCYAALTKGMQGKELTEIGLLSDAGVVAFTDGEKPTTNAKTLSRALKYAEAFDAMIVQHPEEPTLADGGLMNKGELSSRLGLAGIPREAEVIMVERDLRLAAMSGTRFHFAHVTTSDALDAIRKAKAQGLPVTCDTAPHYFALNETAIGNYRTFAKVSPPLRDEADRQAVVAAIADGTIDAIASDHAPHDQDSKRLPFPQASFGIIGLETLLPLTLELYHNRHMSLLEALAAVTCKPADLLRLKAGRLRRGAPADLVVFDPDRPWQIDETQMKSRSKNTPFDKRPVQGKVLMTIVDGRTLYRASDAPL
ncbi:dihydroorotase [Hwanghaeella sp.]|uniref:dihydroorotase n=1 Tax=Hwanghaeella sp. TaxID=2605943 RepID=UPI003CCC09B8